MDGHSFPPVTSGHPEPTWYRLAFPYLWHPAKNVVSTACVYMVVAVAAERYVQYVPTHTIGGSRNRFCFSNTCSVKDRASKWDDGE